MEEYLLVIEGVKMGIENAKEHTVLDVAMLWADPRVANLIMDKFQKMGLLGKDDDKKGGKGKKGGKKEKGKKGTKGGKKSGKAGGKKKGKKKKKKKKGEDDDETTAEPESIFDKYQKDSIIMTATAIASGVREHAESITYVPKRSWINMPTSRDLLREKESLRKQWGQQKDFPKTFQKPMGENVQNKIELMGGLED